MKVKSRLESHLSTEEGTFRSSDSFDKLIGKNYFKTNATDNSMIEIFNNKDISQGRYRVVYSENIGYSLYQITKNKQLESKNYLARDFYKIMDKEYSFKVYNKNLENSFDKYQGIKYNKVV